MAPRVAATLPCRSESTRLYGKPLQQVGERPILEHLVAQLERVDAIDEIVLAIGDAPSKRSYVDFATTHGLEYVVGSTERVLDRLIDAAEAVAADTVVRTTTENPVVYWENLTELVESHTRAGADFSVTRDLPHGVPVEVVSIDALRTARDEGEQRHRGEASTSYITENPGSFTIQTADPPAVLRRPEIRVTVDNPCDLQFVRAVYERLPDESEPLSLFDVVDVIDEHPALLDINGHKPDGTDEAVRSGAPIRYGTDRSRDSRT